MQLKADELIAIIGAIGAFIGILGTNLVNLIRARNGGRRIEDKVKSVEEEEPQ